MLTERIGGVLVVRMDAGENRFTDGSLDFLEHVLDEVAGDESVTALVTTGSGKFFSNGLDVEVLGSHAAGAYLDRVVTVLARVVELPVITVAAINGHAFGAGAMLALAHDLRVMRDDRGYFCLPEVDLGLPFLPIMSALCQCKLSHATAQEAMTQGLRYGGERALTAQIVHALASDAELVDQAVALASERGGKNRTALATIKADVFAPILTHRP